MSKKPVTADDVKETKKLVREFRKKERALLRRPEASEGYWNCDGWGSGSGVREAAAWVENELAAWLAKRIKK